MSAYFIALHSQHSSVLLECPPHEAPLWRYWGPRLPDNATHPCELRATRPLPSFMLDYDQPLTVVPTFGVGWFGQSALLSNRDSLDFAQAITQCEVEWITPGQSVVLHLTDTVAQLQIDVSLSLESASDVLTLKSGITNLAEVALDVQWLAAATLPLPGHAAQVRSYAGQHNHEFMLQTDTLSRSLWRRENRRGRTSHDCFPGAVVTTPDSTEHSGLLFGAHQSGSRNHQQSIEWLHDGQYQWQLGEWLAPGEGRLQAGQSLQTPEVVASCSTQGLNGLAANFHTELRRRLNWPGGSMRPRPVHLNTWEAFYFDLKPADLMELASAAAVVGIERFVLDDGWFHGRNHDRAGLGDWWTDTTKFPQGLAPLANHVNALGMEFGLWVEPEMVNPDSDLFRAHPDWALQITGRSLITARNQLVLNIAHQPAADYLFDRLTALLENLPIRYLKWDHNRDLTTAALAGGMGTAGYRAQVLAVYALLGRLRAAHPEVEIESCSGGGGRIDFAMLRHTHRVWGSDCIDALSRVDIQCGFSQFFPPEILGSHIGTAPAHTTGRSQSLAFRAAVAMTGHLGVELDVRHLDASTSHQLSAWIGRYKQWRDQIHHGRVWRGEGADGLVWQAHGDAAAQDVLLFVFRIAPSSHRYTPPLRLSMLDTGSRYRVQQLVPIDGDGAVQSRAPFFTELLKNGVEIDGAWIAQAGLPMPRATAESCFIVRLRKLSA